LPLMYQPGEIFVYHTGSDVLGVLIARLTGQSLETVLRERIFEPLGMTDTSFFVPAGKRPRLATSYTGDPETGELMVFDGVADSQWGQPPPFESGGGGLVGTVDDYLTFARVLLNNGGGRLAPSSVASMVTNQLTPSQQPGVVPYLGEEGGWGFGVATQPGRYGWNGGLGTTWWTYPDVGLIAILLTQRATFPHTDPLHGEFATLAREAVED